MFSVPLGILFGADLTVAGYIRKYVMLYRVCLADTIV